MLEEEKIALLKRELIEYATLVEAMIDKSIRGLVNKERDVLIEVIEKDEPKTNNFEIKLDELCTVVIAQYQPKGKWLRTVLMILKINNDLERMADHVANIAESGLSLIEERPTTQSFNEILQMAEVTKGMLKNSIDSFVQEDSQLAYGVCTRDNMVDELRNLTRKEILGGMCVDASTVETSLNVLRIARNLERIADLSTNIGEDVIFMVEGKVIKHKTDKM